MKHGMMIVGVFALLVSGAQLSVAADGKEVYDKKCGSCHNKGTMGAPKLGDKEKWAALVKGGQGPLDEAVAKGKGKMPKIAIPAEDIKASNEYLIKGSQ